MSIGGNPPFGWAGPDPIRFMATNRTGATLQKGQVVALDLAASDGDVTDNDIGAQDSGLANVIKLADVVGIIYGVACVAEEIIANDAYGKFIARGICKVLIGTSSGTDAIVDNDLLYPTIATLWLDDVATATVGARALAIMLDTTTGTLVESTPVLATVMFDGYSGWRTFAAS